MSTPDYGTLVSGHRQYFQSGATRSVEWREKQLTALRAMMNDHAEDFYAALWTDLRRNRIDADWSDVKYIRARSATHWPCGPVRGELQNHEDFCPLPSW